MPETVVDSAQIDRAYRLFFGAITQGGIEPLVKVAYKLLGKPIVVGDEVGTLVMLWPDVDMPVPAWQEMRERRTIPHEGFLEVNQEYRDYPVESNRVCVVRGHFLYEGTQAIVRFEENGRAVGFLSLNYGDDEPSATDIQIAGILAEALRPELLRLQQRSHEQEDYLLQLLRSPDRESVEFKLAVTELTRKYPGDYRVFVARERLTGGASSLESIRRRINRSTPNAIAVDWGASLVILEYRAAPAGPDSALIAILRAYPVQFACSTPFSSTTMIPGFLMQAQATLDVGRLRNPEKPSYTYHDYAPLQLFYLCGQHADLSVFIHPAVKTLLAYDLQHQTDLAPTLEAFLQYQTNRAKTAAHLHIHPNTLAYRLRRITELTAIDLEDAALMAELSVSLIAEHVLDAGAAPAEREQSSAQG